MGGGGSDRPFKIFLLNVCLHKDGVPGYDKNASLQRLNFITMILLELSVV